MTSHLPCDPATNPRTRGQFIDSRYVESIMEHGLLSDLLQYCWFVQDHRVEVIRPEVDLGGYDLVLEAKGRVRHVQLKSRWQDGGNREVRINSRLREHPDPCVVWIFWKADPATCRVDLKFRYSPASKWPPHVPGESSFELNGAHFDPLPGYFDIAALVAVLF